jgi:hypothetical protein
MIFKKLPPPFHWRSVRNIDIEEVPKLALALGIELESDFRIKSNWNYYKQYDVFDIDGKPLLHIKKSMDKDVFFEALALHLGMIIDPELCPENYIVGNYDVGFWRWKSPIPFVLTTYCEGEPLKKEEIPEFLFQIGRHFIFHKILELHDVHERHFLNCDGILKRVDYDLSFRELDGKYSGFDRWIKKYNLFDKSKFLQGANFETKLIIKNILERKNDFKEILAAVRFISIEMEEKIFDVFYDNLMIYWRNNCSEIFRKINKEIEIQNYNLG